MKSVSAFVCILALVAVACADDSSSNNNSNDVNSGELAENQVKQCSCDQVDKCWKQGHEQMKPCVEKCKEQLTAEGLDQEKAKQCLEHKKDPNSCHKKLQQKMCALDEDTMINKKDAWTPGQHPHRHHKNKTHSVDSNEVDDVEKHVAGGHRHRHGHHKHFGFFHFIKVNFGESAKAFGKCMKACWHEKKNKSCLKELGCSIKKLSKEDFKSNHEQCKDAREEKHQKLCDCLTDAGMKDVKCEFGKKNKKNHDH